MSVEVMEALEYIEDSYMKYSLETLVRRAFPNIYDGLKPAQRRILFAMLRNKVFQFTKCNSVDGMTMMIHPHGSTYDVLVNLIREDNQNLNFVTGKGSFGYRTSKFSRASASRYTDCKLSPIGKDIMSRMDEAEMMPTYDESAMEPINLAVDIPMVLCMASEGMAVGFSTKIPPFNVTEVIEATKMMILGEKAPLLYPDFPTGGYILRDDASARNCMLKGTGGSFTLRGKFEYNKKKGTLDIIQVPYYTSRETIIQDIKDCMEKGLLDDVKDVKDLTDKKKGLRVSIFIKKGTDLEALQERLYTLTSMQTSASYSLGVQTPDEGFAYLGAHSIISRWLDWKRESIRNGMLREVDKLRDTCDNLRGIANITDIDRLIEIIRFSADPRAVIMNEYDLTEGQANFILNMKLRRINTKEFEDLIQEWKELEEKIKKILDNSQDIVYIDSIIVERLDAFKKKHGKERKTIIDDFVVKNASSIKNSIVEDFACYVAVTKEGYIYKTTGRNRDKITLKPTDEIVFEMDGVRNTGEVLIFSDDKCCYKYYLDDITTNPKKLGDKISQKVLTAAVIDDSIKYIVHFFEEGRVSVIDANSFKTETKRKKLSNALPDLNLIQTDSCNTLGIYNISYSKGKDSELNLEGYNVKTTKKTQGVQYSKRQVKKVQKIILRRDA